MNSEALKTRQINKDYLLQLAEIHKDKDNLYGYMTTEIIMCLQILCVTLDDEDSVFLLDTAIECIETIKTKHEEKE